jgi:hypothetical protein
MGKLISIRVVLARREGYHMTEEQAAVLRGFCEWMASRYGSPETLAMLAKRSRPQVQPGSKARLKVVSRRRSGVVSSTSTGTTPVKSAGATAAPQRTSW